jgi:hypothetical protein
LALWLSSVTLFNPTTDQLTIGKPPRLPLNHVASLPEEGLLCLRQIARQGRLSPEEHAIHFQLNSTTSESRLAQLAHWGLIERKEDGPYRLRAELEGCVYRVLRQKGLAG